MRPSGVTRVSGSTMKLLPLVLCVQLAYSWMALSKGLLPKMPEPLRKECMHLSDDFLLTSDPVDFPLFHRIVSWATATNLDDAAISGLVHPMHHDAVCGVFKIALAELDGGSLRLLETHEKISKSLWIDGLRWLDEKLMIITALCYNDRFKSLFQVFLEVSFVDDKDQYDYSVKLEGLLLENLCDDILKLCMACPLLPVRRSGGGISPRWLRVILDAIKQQNYSLLLAILARWHNFKSRVNLHVTPCDELGRKQPYAILKAAIDACSGQSASQMAKSQAILVLIVSRFWIFSTIGYHDFESSYYQRLCQLIPEIGRLDWGKAEGSYRSMLDSFVTSLGTRHPNNVGIQVMYLVSRPMSYMGPQRSLRSHYVEEAIRSQNKHQLMAATLAYCMEPGWIPQIYEKAVFQSIYPLIDSMVPFSISSEVHMNRPVVALIVEKLSCGKFEASRSARKLFAILGRMGPMSFYSHFQGFLTEMEDEEAFLRSCPPGIEPTGHSRPLYLDDALKLLELIQWSIGKSVSVYVAKICLHVDGQVLLDCIGLASALKCRASRVFLCSILAKRAGKFNENELDHFYRVIVEVHFNRHLESLNYWVSALPAPAFERLLLKSTNQPTILLFGLLWKMRKHPISARVSQGLLQQSSQLSSTALFQFLIDHRSSDWDLCIQKSILHPAIIEGRTEITEIVLSDPGFPLISKVDGMMLAMINAQDLSIIPVILQAPYAPHRLNLVFQENALLKRAVAESQTKIVELLLLDLKVFKRVLETNDSAAVVELMPLFPITMADSISQQHRDFVASIDNK